MRSVDDEQLIQTSFPTSSVFQVTDSLIHPEDLTTSTTVSWDEGFPHVLLRCRRPISQPIYGVRELISMNNVL